MPTFSVIINNYNYGRYLGEAIESILAQTISDCEIIVVDDGSSDNSRDIVRSYGDRVKLIETSRLGQARACLHAARFAQGTFLYFLDADDRAKPKLLERAKAHLGQQVTKLQFQLEPIDSLGQSIGPPFPSYDSGCTREQQIADILLTGHYKTPQTSGNIFRRSIFELIKDIPYERAIDGITLLVAPFLGEVLSINEPLAEYRIHASNTSSYLNPVAHRFVQEKERFVSRYYHLKELVGANEHQFSDPTRMLFFHDRKIMSEFSANGYVQFNSAVPFLRALYRENGTSVRTIKLAVFVLALVLGPRSIANQVFQIHAYPWSKLKSLRGLRDLLARKLLPQ